MTLDTDKIIEALVVSRILRPGSLVWSQQQKDDFEDGYEFGRCGEDMPSDESPAFIAGWQACKSLGGKRLSEVFPHFAHVAV